MKKDDLSSLIALCASFGKPKTQEQYDNWIEYGKAFDLYREPSSEPLTKKTLCYFCDKENETEESKEELKNLQLICSGEQFIAVFLNVFEQVKKPSIKVFVKALNYYNETNVFWEIEP